LRSLRRVRAIDPQYLTIMQTSIPVPASRAHALWRSLVVLLITATAYDLLFWEQDIGVNLPLYAALVIGALLGRYGWKGLSRPALIVMSGLMVACFNTIWHNSVVAIITSFICLLVFTALAHEMELRSLFYGMAQVVANYALLPFGASRSVSEALDRKRVPRTGWRWFKLALMPVALLAVYFQIYRVANPKFDHLTAGVLDALSRWLNDLFSEILTPHTLFYGFAILLSAGLLFRFAPRMLADHERQWTELLLRRRTRRPHWLAPLALNALERERKTGLILLVLMNLLLVVVNIIDVLWIWTGFEVPEDFSLKQFVHEGTWLLIISILLSMAILLRLFRGNQNFYRKSGAMRVLAFAWIAQNFILGISVFLRNYHYIQFHGLAYKRIGVIVFLALVLVGLVTLYLKIRHRKSFFHLLRVNAWAVLFAFIGLTAVDWDALITRYNLEHWNKGEIDVDNYLAMSDKVLPILYANKDKVEQQIAKHTGNEVIWIRHTTMAMFLPDLEAKRERFLARWKNTGWQGWNRADARTYAELERMGYADPRDRSK
jgi:hypothetical protein